MESSEAMEAIPSIAVTTPENKIRVRLEETATVLVGKDEVAFTIHAEVFRERSAYWKAALSERWKAGRDAIRLQFEYPDEFNLYMRCVYSGIGSIKEDEFSSIDVRIHDLTYVHILADSFGDWQIANSCVDQIKQIFYDELLTLDPDYVAVCYANSTNNSRLRRLCVEVSMLDARFMQCFGSGNTFPADFHYDLAAAQMKLLNECRNCSQQQAGALIKSRLEGTDDEFQFCGYSSPTVGIIRDPSSLFGGPRPKPQLFPNHR